MTTMSERFVSQISSGRWCLTMFAGLSLMAMVVTNCRVSWAVAIGMIPQTPMPFSDAAIMSIIGTVFALYFAKPANGEAKKE